MKDALKTIERAELVRRASTLRHGRQEARRARVILMLGEGRSWSEIIAAQRCSRSFIARWAKRFREIGLAGLQARCHGQQPSVMNARLEARIVAAAAERSPAGTPRWSTRTLGQKLGISHMTVQRVWERHGAGQVAVRKAAGSR